MGTLSLERWLPLFHSRQHSKGSDLHIFSQQMYSYTQVVCNNILVQWILKMSIRWTTLPGHCFTLWILKNNKGLNQGKTDFSTCSQSVWFLCHNQEPDCIKKTGQTCCNLTCRFLNSTFKACFSGLWEMVRWQELTSPNPVMPKMGGMYKSGSQMEYLT